VTDSRDSVLIVGKGRVGAENLILDLEFYRLLLPAVKAIIIIANTDNCGPEMSALHHVHKEE
jgi:hypothetical protein